jgi:hypothetical protein
MKESILTIALFGLVLGAYSMAAQPYTCQPYQPKSECDTGIYRIELRDRHTARYPLAVVESHCIIGVGRPTSICLDLKPPEASCEVHLFSRIKAESGRMTKYNSLERSEIFDVEWFDEQEFPMRNAEVCRVQ